jgi:hypothetical protein
MNDRLKLAIVEGMISATLLKTGKNRSYVIFLRRFIRSRRLTE